MLESPWPLQNSVAHFQRFGSQVSTLLVQVLRKFPSESLSEHRSGSGVVGER